MVSGAPGHGLDAVAAALGDRVARDQPFGALTTYRVGGPAALMMEATSEADLVDVRRALSGHNVPVLFLGNGSNLLVADTGFPGLVVRLGRQFTQMTIPGVAEPGLPADGGLQPEPDPVVVRAGAAAGLPVLARRTVEAGLSGLEWAVGVPGSVGGAVRMNAGGHGADVASCLVRYRWVDVDPAVDGDGSGEDGPERLQFGYRVSSLTSTQVVVWAEFATHPGPVEAGRAASSDIVRWRREHQPGGGNAGSVFVNPPGDSAGRLVEDAGLKGFRLGSARVSEKHANFIVADRGGSAADVSRLMAHVHRVVLERSGIDLRTEIHPVGFPEGENDGRERVAHRQAGGGSGSSGPSGTVSRGIS